MRLYHLTHKVSKAKSTINEDQFQMMKGKGYIKNYDFEVHTDSEAGNNVEHVIAAWKARTTPSIFAEMAGV